MSIIHTSHRRNRVAALVRGRGNRCNGVPTDSCCAARCSSSSVESCALQEEVVGGYELRLTKSQTEWVADASAFGINLPSVAATLALPTWVLPVIGLGLMTQARIATSYGKCLGFNIVEVSPTTWAPVPIYYSCKG